MHRRIIIGGLVAGLATFIWGAISHIALGLGNVGIKSISNEAPVLAALQGNIKEAGFYYDRVLDLRNKCQRLQQMHS